MPKDATTWDFPSIFNYFVTNSLTYPCPNAYCDAGGDLFPNTCAVFAKFDPSWKVNVPNLPWILEIKKGACVGCGSSTNKTLNPYGIFHTKYK